MTNIMLVGHIVFSPTTCAPNDISQSEKRLHDGHVTSESCLLTLITAHLSFKLLQLCTLNVGKDIHFSISKI